MREHGWNFGFGGDFAPDRIFRKRGGLKYYVLWLLHEKPMKGAEIMAEIERQTHGWWKPSPGTIYPLLSGMEEQGLIVKKGESGYAITDAGLDEIGLKGGFRHKETDSTDKAFTELDGIVSYLEDTAPHSSERKEEISRVIERLKKITQ